MARFIKAILLVALFVCLWSSISSIPVRENKSKESNELEVGPNSTLETKESLLPEHLPLDRHPRSIGYYATSFTGPFRPPTFWSCLFGLKRRVIGSKLTNFKN